MTKPIVFISHSSKDERMVRRLKELLAKKVGNTLDIFVSCDGQSIPLGRNWVHEIEQALKDSRIMFVLLSPNSIRSNWIYFEAGFAYSKDIKVVPIGMLGIDLSQVTPPMSLLQGFNINSAESLNNIISVLNREFDYSLEASFNREEYGDIFGIQRVNSSRTLKEYVSLVNDISTQVVSGIDKPMEAIIEYFKSSKVEYQSSERMIDTYGMSIEKTENLITCRIDPNLLDLTIPLIGETIRTIRGSNFDFFPFTVDFVPTVNCIQERHKITSRMYKTEIKILDNNDFGYADMSFNIARRYYWKGSPYVVGGTFQYVGATAFQSGGLEYEVGTVYMEVKYHGKNLAEMPISSLLSRLFELGILY